MVCGSGLGMPPGVCELRRGCQFLSAIVGLTCSHHQKVPACQTPDWPSLCPKDTGCGALHSRDPVRGTVAEGMSYRHSKGQTLGASASRLAPRSFGKNDT